MGSPGSWVNHWVESGQLRTACCCFCGFFFGERWRAVVLLKMSSFVKQISSQCLTVTKCAAILEIRKLIMAQLQVEKICFLKVERCQCWASSNICLSCNMELFGIKPAFLKNWVCSTLSAHADRVHLQLSLSHIQGVMWQTHLLRVWHLVMVQVEIMSESSQKQGS